MTLQFNFKDKSAVITGGARGIGLSIAHEFLKSGARVAIWDLGEIDSAVKRELTNEFGSRFSLHQVDITDPQACALAARELQDPIDILVNNAGITRDQSFAKMSEQDFELVIKTNLGGVFYVTKSLLAKFSNDAVEKRIINISSIVALYGNFGQANYAAAKAGVIGLTKTLARELGRKGFTVNAIAPGFIQTDMVEKMRPEIRQSIQEKIPRGRLGNAEDIANTCLFLASDAAAYINGAVINVDGGLFI